jgi:quinoprotein dehydrogenase-associated probable ABC transporter substrate-binding protein
MSSAFLSLAAILLAASGLYARDLRVCADPNNLPFSNTAGEGFENKVAEIIARDLGANLRFVWQPERNRFVRESLVADKCDLIVGLPAGFPSVLTTRPWYCSTYVLLTRDLPLQSLHDPALRRARIGVHVVGEDYAPPAEELEEEGLIGNIVPFSLFGAEGEANPPARLVEAVAQGKVDAAIIWGPFAGYFTKHLGGDFKIAPTPPYEFKISSAVQAGNQKLKSEVQQVLDARRDEINRILDEYGAPLCASKPSL